MLGAIIGDIVGSRFEFSHFKSRDFNLFDTGCSFTDDSICTAATADWLLQDEHLEEKRYAAILRNWCRRYPHPQGGYGARFEIWIHSDTEKPYGSFGNGSAMRVSPVGWAFSTMEETLEAAAITARVTHNHPEGIKGAQATAAAIFLARNGSDKAKIKKYIEKQFEYDLSKTCDEIRPGYRYNEICQDTVPQAIIAFLDSSGFEDAIRNAVSLGGDADTLTCITGSIAEAFYGLKESEDIVNTALNYLPAEIKAVLFNFQEKFQSNK